MKHTKSLIIPITGISHTGKGVGRIEGKVAFVEAALPEELVETEIIKEHKNFFEAKVVGIIEPSMDRITTDCPHYGVCEGCAFRHVKYLEEVNLKTRIVKETLVKIAGVDQGCVSPCIPSPQTDHYRNKIQYHTRKINGKPKLGFVGKNYTFIPILDCKLADRDIIQWAEIIEQVLPEDVTRVVIKKSKFQEKLLCLFVSPVKIVFTEAAINMIMKFPKAAAIFGNVANTKSPDILSEHTYKIAGEEYLLENINGLTFAVGPTSFYQVNPYQIENLYNLVLQHLQKKKTLLDLFCGVGTITLCAANKAEKVYGVEINKEAISYAKKNALLNNIDNVEFKAMNAKDISKHYNTSFDTIILDPPRSGCSQEVLNFVADKTKHLIYVSCESSTLARDIKILKTFGFEVKSVYPVDMFPRTPHVEVVTLLTRSETTQ